MTRPAGIDERRRVVADARDFGRVAVLYGGFSSEREVSLDSGMAVYEALRSRGVDADCWDPAKKDISQFVDAGFDRAWIALHGTGGEDGAIQGTLQWIDVPYSGSGVKASALAMDKVRSKHLFEAAAIPTPEYVVINDKSDAVQGADELGYPLVMKPAEQGSSVGMTIVFEAAELGEAAELALRFDGVAIMERCIVGDELTVAILQGEALPSIRIETPRVFYDYRAKYKSERTEYHCPGTRGAEPEQQYADMAIAAFDELGCSGWGRVDFMSGNDGQPLVLEVNTIPGMTSHSLVPMAAKRAGIDFEELCWRILETSVACGAIVDDVKGVAHGT